MVRLARLSPLPESGAKALIMIPRHFEHPGAVRALSAPGQSPGHF